MRSLLENRPRDLIADIMMPGDHGLVLCRELRSGKHRRIPSAATTWTALGLEMGADDYLVKPQARTAGPHQGDSAAHALPPNFQVI